jgi:hypothetical protein
VARPISALRTIVRLRRHGRATPTHRVRGRLRSRAGAVVRGARAISATIRPFPISGFLPETDQDRHHGDHAGAEDASNESTSVLGVSGKLQHHPDQADRDRRAEDDIRHGPHDSAYVPPSSAIAPVTFRLSLRRSRSPR